MSIYKRIKASNGKMPRKLKKKIKKIPVGRWCYGSAIGDKGKVVNHKRDWVTICCPYFHDVSKINDEDEDVSYCSFIKKTDDFLLTDMIKICDNYESFFKEFKNS